MGGYCGLVLLLFAVNTNTGPGDCVKADFSDRLLAIHTDAECALIHTPESLVDRAKQFCICLFQRQIYMKIIFLAGMIDPVTGSHSFVSHSRTVWRGFDFLSLAQEDLLVFFQG